MSSTLAELLPTLALVASDRETRHSLAALARSAGQSPSSFQRAFSRVVGESPKQYTRRLQLESAALALLTTESSVLDVALDAGFESHEGFTRAFAAHFTLPPKDFRARHQHLARDATNADLVHHTGPCIGLFRSSLAPFLEPAVNYDITRQPLPAMTFLYGVGRCTHAAIAQTLGPLLGQAFTFAMTNGLELRSPPTTLYVEWGPGMVTMHAGLAIGAAPSVPLPASLHVAELPACAAAVTIHTGSYDGLADAHAAMDQFLHEHGWAKGGPAREVYVTDPGEVPDPAHWKTQIVWPLREVATHAENR